MELYSYFRSSAAYRVRIAFNLKGLQAGEDYQLIAVNLVAGEQRSEDFLKVNPQGLVPALLLDSGDIVAQSFAILDWLEREHPKPPLLPTDSLNRAMVIATVQAIAADIHPLNNLRVLNYLQNDLQLSEEQRTGWYHHWLKSGFTALEARAAAPYYFGERVTLADVYLVPQLLNAHRFQLDMSPYPKLSAIEKVCNELKEFQTAHPDMQPDNPEKH